MKKSMKRIIAMLCAFVMLVGGLWTGAEQTANAAEWMDNELVVYQNKTIESAMLYDKGLKLDLSGKDVANLSLYVKMTFTDQQYSQATSNGQVKNWRIKFSNYTDKTDGYEVQVNPTINQAGTYEETFSLATWANTTSSFSLDSVIKSCRIYNGDGTNQKMTDVVINVLKFVYTPPAVEEEDKAEPQKWTIYENKAVSDNLIGNIFTDTNLNIDLSEKKDDWSQLSFYVRMSISESVYNSAVAGQWRIKFSNVSDLSNEAMFIPNVTSAGTYEQTFSFAEMGDKERLNLSKAILSCRLYNNGGSTSISGVVIEEMKIIYTPNEWTVYKNKSLTADVSDSALNINLGKTVVDKSKLSLYLKMEVTTAAQATNNWRIKLSNSTSTTGGEAYIQPNVTRTGEYEYEFSFCEMKNGESLDVSKTIVWCGIWLSGGASVSGATIKEMKIIYTPNEWTLYKNKDVSTSMVSNTFTDQSLNVNLNKTTDDLDNLALYVKMTIPAEVYQKTAAYSNTWRIKLCNTPQTDMNAVEASFKPNITSQGTNEYCFAFEDIEDIGKLKLDQAITSCRIWCNGDKTSISGVTIDEIKIIDTTPYVEEYQSKAWSIFEKEAISQHVWNTAWNYSLGDTSVNEANLALYVSLDIPEDMNVDVIDDDNENLWRIKIANVSINTNEDTYKPVVMKTGVNEYMYPLKGSSVNWAETVNCLRVYHNDDKTDLTGVKITMKIVDTRYYIDAGKTPDEVYADTFHVPDGYTFAGWYTDSNCTTASALKRTVEDGSVYAKFVRAGVQNIKAQGAKNDDGTAAIRFITTVDSLQYKKVGFDITINGKTLSKESTVVYEKLYATGSASGANRTYTPEDIDAASRYFNTYTIDNIPSSGWSENITVQTYWITQDGTKVVGETRTYTINDFAI